MEISISLLLMLVFITGIAFGTILVVILTIYFMSEEL
jgi:hypothetical protein